MAGSIGVMTPRKPNELILSQISMADAVKALALSRAMSS
jgi:hypothetical protein